MVLKYSILMLKKILYLIDLTFSYTFDIYIITFYNSKIIIILNRSFIVSKNSDRREI